MDEPNPPNREDSTSPLFGGGGTKASEASGVKMDWRFCLSASGASRFSCSSEAWANLATTTAKRITIW